MKKWLVFALVAIMMLSATAYAVPSKTTSDVTLATAPEAATEGVVIPEECAIAVVNDSETVNELVSDIYTFATEKQEPIVDFFDADTQVALSEKLPVDFDMTKLEMNEFISVAGTGYKEEYGDLWTTFKFTTEYKPGQKVVAMIGFTDGSRDADGKLIYEWIPMDAEVQDNGTVKVLFTKDVMLKLQNGSAAMAILSESADAVA